MDLKCFEDEEIKEFHFHIYHWQNNPKSVKSSEDLKAKLRFLVEKGFFHVVFSEKHASAGPIGPHITAMFEVWCPKEHFARLYQFFVLHRGDHSVLIHPLTKQERKDHTSRAVWMGHPLPLDVEDWVKDVLPEIPLEHPELGLGYSAKK